ncbi:hypothetical protein BJF78_02555 [Pseudonocardia sp. CNS-139]|nr:hypothetical protein BJF78_02555 [Pseudonocardia sp. CNS-139]
MPSNGSDEAEPRWLSCAELESWMRFSAMVMKLQSALDADLQRASGLSLFTYLVLAGLSEAPDRTLRMTDLAVLGNGSLSRLSHAVAKLERKGWVRRRPSPEDGRITLATLTDDGFEKLRSAAPGHVASVRRLVVDVLAPDELHRLGEISTRLLDATAGGSSPGPGRRGSGDGDVPAACTGCGAPAPPWPDRRPVRRGDVPLGRTRAGAARGRRPAVAPAAVGAGRRRHGTP